MMGAEGPCRKRDRSNPLREHGLGPPSLLSHMRQKGLARGPPKSLFDSGLGHSAHGGDRIKKVPRIVLMRATARPITGL